MKAEKSTKILRVLLAMIAMLLATSVCFAASADINRPKSAPKLLKLNVKAKTLYIGSNGSKETVQLRASLSAPAGKAASPAGEGKWSSNNAKVVKVDAEGRLTPVGVGNTLVSYTASVDGKKQRASCKIAVKAVVPTSVSFDQPRSVIGAGTRVELSVSVKPSDAYNKKVVFKSSNPAVASVSKSGVIAAKKPGKATISCQTVSGKRKASLKITVIHNFSGVKYRLYAIGNASYQGEGKLPGCKNDLKMVKAAFESASFSGKKAQVTAKTDLTGKEMRRMLGAMADGASDGDVTVFYYSGHGMNGGGYDGALCGVDWDLLSVKEVQRYLDKVPGKVVVILDCCLSGQYIGKDGTAKSAGTSASAFNRAVVSAFSSAASEKALTDSPQKKKYKILTAAGPRQASYLSRDRQEACSVFSDYLAQAMGQELDEGTLASMAGDGNGDSVVTLNELYKYVDKRVKSYLKRYPSHKQTTMVWPKGDSFPVIARN